MGLNKKGILKISGVCCRIIGLAMLVPVLVALIYGEYETAVQFTLTAGATVAGSLLLSLASKNASRVLKMRDGFLIVTLVWFIAAIIGGIPYMMTGTITDPFKAFFEACSGFSTTGASVLSDFDSIPKGVVFWRSFTHWLGGIGIIVIAVALLPSLGLSGQNVVRAETPGPVLDKITPKMNDMARYICLVYGTLTVAELILLCLGGMGVFDALITTFGTAGTGGFTNHDASIEYYSSTYFDVVITIFMLLAGTSFNLHYQALRRGPKAYFKDSEFSFYIFIVLVFSAVIAVDLYATGFYTTASESADKAFFQTISIATTTGFTNADFGLWPELSKMLLFILMFIGGCSGSSAGGVKAVRILIVLKYIRKGIAIRLHPNAVMDVRINGRRVPSQTMSSVVTFIFLYAVALVLGTLLVSFDNIEHIACFSGALSCLGNYGPAFGLVGPEINYAVFSDFSSVVLSLLMIAGRLELITFFVIFTPEYWKPGH
ncbi:MAG: TrkH family potassium uptake protein [Firmicutes bacterium]|nr:TrkH family potassium uptake protein [Bacillota bacterium]